MSNWIFTYGTDDLTELANQVKDVIKDSTGYDDLDDYVVTVGKASTFRDFAKKWLGFDPKKEETDKGLKIFVTKVVKPTPDLKVVE